MVYLKIIGFFLPSFHLSVAALLFRRAAKKLSDFSFLNWFLHVFRSYFAMFSQMLSV